MINIILGTALFAVSYGADNIALNGATKCNNYVAMYSDLEPVGACFQENTDATDECAASVSSGVCSTSLQNYMWKCMYDTEGVYGNVTADPSHATTFKMVRRIRMTANCKNEIRAYQDYSGDYQQYPCNGVDDQCECEIDGDASECTFYEETSYPWGLSLSSGWYCNKKQKYTYRYITNMCIQGGDFEAPGWSSTYSYTCGGYDYRTGEQDAGYIYSAESHGSSGTDAVNCGGTAATTTTTTSTTMANPPTGAPTVDAGGLYCTERTCGTVDGPRADLGNTYQVGMAMLFVVVNAIIFA